MGQFCELSRVTNDYLAEFEKILDDMICAMTNAPQGNSITCDFIAQMIPHHMAAIEMSHNILKYTTNIQLQGIADNIISEQTKSIENMREVEKCCGAIKNSECDVKRYHCKMDEIFAPMFEGMRNAQKTNCLNCNFIREMIPHHMGAVKMAENTLCFDICDELKPILKAIIISQKRGIEQMQRLMRRLCCK